jgi:RNA polymerase sigma-70 factor (ECF subfamily)
MGNASQTSSSNPRQAPELDAAMQRYATGDDAAFAQLHAGLAPRLSIFLRRVCGKRDLAEDLTQETLLRIHRARSSFAPHAAVVPWAYAIARNCYIDHMRATKARIKLTSPTDEDGEPLVPEPTAGIEASAEEAQIARQTAEIIERELRRMTVARREAFVLLRYEGLSVAEAAQVLGATPSAVKLRAFHAYEAIRKALSEVDRLAEGGS